MSNEVNYVGGAKKAFKDDKEKKNSTSKKVDYGIWTRDIAQSHHFTVFVQGLTAYKVPNSSYSDFLPVKNMSLSYTSYENMSIPLQIFGDFPILNRKRVATINLTCYDTDDNLLEHSLRVWESMCFPQNKYVAFMEDIARKFEYRGYNVKGLQTLMAQYFVIPAGNVSVSRDYSANDAKLISFGLVVVGDGVSAAIGNSNNTVNNRDADKAVTGTCSYVTGTCPNVTGVCYDATGTCSNVTGKTPYVTGTSPYVTGTSSYTNSNQYEFIPYEQAN